MKAQVLTINAVMSNPRSRIGEMHATNPEDAIKALRTYLDNWFEYPWEFGILEDRGLLLIRRLKHNDFGKFEGVICTHLNPSPNARSFTLQMLVQLGVADDLKSAEYQLRINSDKLVFSAT
jgi:endonuclease/exonuclease/phosphatase family metal-dependent hydrolase